MTTPGRSTAWLCVLALSFAAAGCDIGRGIDEGDFHLENLTGSEWRFRTTDGAYDNTFGDGEGVNIPPGPDKVGDQGCWAADLEVVDPSSERVVAVREGPLCPGEQWRVERDDLTTPTPAGS